MEKDPEASPDLYHMSPDEVFSAVKHLPGKKSLKKKRLEALIEDESTPYLADEAGGIYYAGSLDLIKSIQKKISREVNVREIRFL